MKLSARTIRLLKGAGVVLYFGSLYVLWMLAD